MNPVFVTSNPEKLSEAEKLLGFDLERRDIELEEIQAVELEKVVRQKAYSAYEEVGKPVIVTDTGLFIDELNGFPGALVKWMYKRIGDEGISKMAGGSKAEAVTVIGYFDGEEMRSFKGSVEGRIAEKPRGEKGFGWDPIFVPEDDERTFAEMTEKEKNEVSMRKKALEKIREEI